MAVEFRPRFNGATIRKIIEERLNRVRQAAILRFMQVGETFVTNARNNHTYTDRTGNLTSSIGYVVLVDGVQEDENFQGTKEGVKAARDFIDSIQGEYPSGIALICVAGMDYAAAVEAKGRDVITGSSLTAKTALKKAVESLSKK